MRCDDSADLETSHRSTNEFPEVNSTASGDVEDKADEAAAVTVDLTRTA